MDAEEVARVMFKVAVTRKPKFWRDFWEGIGSTGEHLATEAVIASIAESGLFAPYVTYRLSCTCNRGRFWRCNGQRRRCVVLLDIIVTCKDGSPHFKFGDANTFVANGKLYWTQRNGSRY